MHKTTYATVVSAVELALQSFKVHEVFCSKALDELTLPHAIVSTALRVWMGGDHYEVLTDDLLHLTHDFESAVAEWSSHKSKLDIN